MNLLFYWKKKYFKQDANNISDTFYSVSSKLYSSIQKGETLWVFAKHLDHYVLFGKFIIKSTSDVIPSKYGDFSAKINQANKHYFKVDRLPAQHALFEKFLKKTDLAEKWNDEIALHFQGKAHIKEIKDTLNSDLDKFARKIKLY